MVKCETVYEVRIIADNKKSGWSAMVDVFNVTAAVADPVKASEPSSPNAADPAC